MCESRRRGPDNARGDVMRCFCARREGGEAGGVCVCGMCVCWLHGGDWVVDYLMFDLSPY